jgi:hypothetical protein
MNVYPLTFFDQYLLGEPSALLKGDSPRYPARELRRRFEE